MFAAPANHCRQLDVRAFELRVRGGRTFAARDDLNPMASEDLSKIAHSGMVAKDRVIDSAAHCETVQVIRRHLRPAGPPIDQCIVTIVAVPLKSGSFEGAGRVPNGTRSSMTSVVEVKGPLDSVSMPIDFGPELTVSSVLLTE